MNASVSDREAATPLAATRLEQLVADFVELAPQLADGPEKKALSLLHGMIQELWRADAGGGSNRQRGPTIEEIVNLHQHVPAMEGDKQNEPLAAGSAAPDFALPDANGHIHRLSDYRGRTVVLAFYPLDWSPGCSRQLDLYQQELDEFQSRGVDLLGISVDSLDRHDAWSAARESPFLYSLISTRRARSRVDTTSGGKPTVSPSARSTSSMARAWSATPMSRPS